jgi:hypothetical protein
VKPLTKDDILGADAYERERPGLRQRMMLIKDRRRVTVGDHCSVHFECRDTLGYQVHEMLRAEHSWSRPGAVEAELEAYNPLIPAAGELSATVMFEFDDEEERRVRFAELVGIDRHLTLVIGDTPPMLARFDRMQIDDQRISSVQFVKWDLDDCQRALLKTEGTVLRLVIDHPKYAAQAVLSETTRKAIMHDPD